MSDRLSVVIYNLFIHVYFAFAKIAAYFNPKAKLFINGRTETFPKLQSISSESTERFWFHCASLGEFEQARPLIEALKKRHKNAFFAVSFFSPSGYEVRKNFSLADVVFYLPKDTKTNAEKLISLLQPTQVFWIKYEFWFHILSALKTQQIPTHLVCANFRNEQVFFKPHGAFFRKQLSFFTTIFVQDALSEKLLKNIGFSSVVAGDTRFDRVTEIATQAKQIPEIETFSKGKKLLIAGSTWNEDIRLLASSLDATFFNDYKLVIVPHDVTKESVEFIESSFREQKSSLRGVKQYPPIIRYSNLVTSSTSATDAQILILDTTGLLASAYRYGAIAYIGGGFGASVHNVLEAAVYGLPTIFGTNYQKSREAIELINLKAAKSVQNSAEMKEAITILLSSSADKIARNYVSQNSGATEKILSSLPL